MQFLVKHSNYTYFNTGMTWSSRIQNFLFCLKNMTLNFTHLHMQAGIVAEICLKYVRSGVYIGIST